MFRYYLVVYIYLADIPFFWHEGGVKEVVRDQGKESLPWKSVDSEAISSMGLTSSVRKVLPKSITC